MNKHTNLLVVSAHAADFVWRCGGTIATYVNGGANVHLVVLSYGARGESGALWKLEGQTEQNVKQIRRGEIEGAAKHLGVTNLEIWDYQDYHMFIDNNRMERLVRKMREVKPQFIVTHPKNDVLNPDHNTVSQYVFEASVLATSAGVRMEGLPHLRQPQIFGYEPHQTELSDYKHDMIIDITDAYEQKKRAMECFEAQPHLIDYYKDRAKMRGNHARRISGNQTYKYAETFTRFYPYVGGEFV
ncbi:PIG-L deacetylase family protein [Alicyclobacillus sp. SO9]|uniref:PIG-L deacetylase family protein n=1 Tax=Alicyclobacillus sp. SO9 TaxID=2665646 RepID=UPI0018E72EDE|nr:PIG-L deacetylase family protein [Alicyclobacillus sp. SO9]QQE77613.1 PIG-L family deacetylase [Alicyclobacillus sp. SO9]